MSQFKNQDGRYVAAVDVRHELSAPEIVDVLRGSSAVPGGIELSDRDGMWRTVEAILAGEGVTTKHRGAAARDDQWKALAVKVASLLPPDRAMEIMQAALGVTTPVEAKPEAAGAVDEF